MGTGAVSPDTTVRALRAGDLEQVIAIDQVHSGTARRRFMERRLAAGARRPDDFVQVGIEHRGTLVGFALGRLFDEAGRFDEAFAPIQKSPARGVVEM